MRRKTGRNCPLTPRLTILLGALLPGPYGFEAIESARLAKKDVIFFQYNPLLRALLPHAAAEILHRTHYCSGGIQRCVTTTYPTQGKVHFQ